MCACVRACVHVEDQLLSGKLSKMFAAKSKLQTRENNSLSQLVVAKMLRLLRNNVFFVVIVRSDVRVALLLTCFPACPKALCK